MDLAISAEQERSQRELARLLEEQCTRDVVRAAEPLGFDAALWASCADVFADTARGTLLDGALAAEQLGRVIAPVPAPEHLAAKRVLVDLDAHTAPDDVCTLALSSTAADVAPLVPAGAVASRVIACTGDAVVVVEQDPSGKPPSNLGTSPIADVALDGATFVAQGAEAVTRYEQAVDEWRVLTAGLLVGLADGALELAVAHVRGREQFGVPIGTFQTVQHRLADLSTDRDGAGLLVRKAAWSADGEPVRRAEFAAMAHWFAGRIAVAVATECLHFHGGWGFTMERDPQLYLRRAKAWSLTLGDPDGELLAVADRRWGPA